jgi:bacterioferritin-associated ferredoxin
MFVCVCQRITDRDLDAAIAAGAGHCGEVFRLNNAIPQCGQCLDVMQDILDQANAIRRQPLATAAE